MVANWYNEYKKISETSINNYLKDYFKNETNTWLDKIKEAVYYSVKWGKRIR